ncbi:hypothetical protein [Campylobacter troglodytis]|nr:hypothetical protein [Campylobacter troglodytis]
MIGEIEVDESYFGVRSGRGKRVCGVGKKHLCFYFVLRAHNCKQKGC